MKTGRWPLVGLLLLFGTAVHAENGCPSGMIPANGTNINSCVPIPPGYYSDQQQAKPPPPQWKSQWGAIASDAPKGILGTATGMASRSEAGQLAQADCQAKGGAPCKLEITYDNECVTLAVGSKGYSINTGNTAETANKLAITTCSADGDDSECRVYYSDCSLPVRIQ